MGQGWTIKAAIRPLVFSYIGTQRTRCLATVARASLWWLPWLVLARASLLAMDPTGSQMLALEDPPAVEHRSQERRIKMLEIIQDSEEDAFTSNTYFYVYSYGYSFGPIHRASVYFIIPDLAGGIAMGSHRNQLESFLFCFRTGCSLNMLSRKLLKDAGSQNIAGRLQWPTNRMLSCAKSMQEDSKICGPLIVCLRNQHHRQCRRLNLYLYESITKLLRAL